MSSTDTPAASPAASAPKHRAAAAPRRTPRVAIAERGRAVASAQPGRHAQTPAQTPALPAARATRRGRRVLTTATLTSSVAALATAVAVGGGVLAAPAGVVAVAGNLAAAAPATPFASLKPTLSADALAARAASVPVSRSDRRDTVDRDKAASLATTDGPAVTGTENLAAEDPRVIARALLAEFGFGAEQFGCLDPLWTGESGWRVNADNPSSSAYGIPQALPGSKMSSAGADWATNPVTQIRWGLGYIRDRYGSPCGAWSFKQGHGFY